MSNLQMMNVKKTRNFVKKEYRIIFIIEIINVYYA